MAVFVTRQRTRDFLMASIARADSALIASPWITPDVAMLLHRRLPPDGLQVLTFPTQQNGDSIRLLREAGRDVSVGPVHAKLTLLRRKGRPWLAVFGSENLTGSHYEELVVTSTDPTLNQELEKSYARFRSRCIRLC